MFDAWWEAHRFEFVIAGGIIAVIVLVTIVQWILRRRKKG